MQQSYIKQYVNHFNLVREGQKYYDLHGYHVLSIVNGGIQVKTNNSWSLIKEGDLLISIINNIPIHD